METEVGIEPMAQELAAPVTTVGISASVLFSSRENVASRLPAWCKYVKIKDLLTCGGPRAKLQKEPTTLNWVFMFVLEK
jgi:hypothetical protein